jgi:TPR repeat protein
LFLVPSVTMLFRGAPKVKVLGATQSEAWYPLAAMTGHSPAVYNELREAFPDEEERANLRDSLASIAFGNANVDQLLTTKPLE